MTSKLTKVIVPMVTAFVSVCGASYAAVQHFQSDLTLTYGGQPNGIPSFIFEAQGESPIDISSPEIMPGGIQATVTRDIYEHDLPELSKASTAKINGPYMSGAVDGLTLFPGKSQSFSFSMESDSELLSIPAYTVGFSYRYRYESEILNKPFSVSSWIGVGRKTKREACFFICGQSGASISCSHIKNDVQDIVDSFCSGDFKDDKTCCTQGANVRRQSPSQS